MPSVPLICKDWIEEASLRDKSDIPGLRPEIIVQVENPDRPQESAQPEFIPRTERLDDHPDIQKKWANYVEELWLPWVQAHDEWASIHEVYSKLFAIHQEQLRRGEEYELILALGLLTWKTPSSQHVRRHLIVANAILEFEARLGKFTVRPLPDGANVRPELDMLDIEEQPVRAGEVAKDSLAIAGDDPWDKNCIEGVLQALVHSINPQGEYAGTLEARDTHTSNKPTVEYAPALILRKRSARGLTDTLKRMEEGIEKGENIPAQFQDLAEIQSGNGDISKPGPDETNSSFSHEVFFPKPFNNEQHQIVEKLQTASGVLVQGPPGTGKSHTIANLICHLLATGQRTLITAKTPRALQVLEGLLPEEVRPLCINLLGGGLEEKRSLEASVGGILGKDGGWNANQEANEIKNLKQKLRELREEKAKVDRRLRDIRESETHSQSIVEGKYRGTAARIAEAVSQDRNLYAWFTDTPPLDKMCPITESQLRSLLTELRGFGPEKRRELGLICPNDLPSVEQFINLVQSEQKAHQEYDRSSDGADERIVEMLASIAEADIAEIRDSLTAFNNLYRRLLTSPYSWMPDGVRDIIGSNVSIWRERERATQTTIVAIEPLVSVADKTKIDLPDGANIRALLEDASKLKEHLENGGKLGWGPFRPRQVREHIFALKLVRVNGSSCFDREHLSVLANVLRVRIECEEVWRFWEGSNEQTQGPYVLQLQALKGLHKALTDALAIGKQLDHCRESLGQCTALREPVWTDESQTERLIASCEKALATQAKSLVADQIRSIEKPVTSLAERTDAHPVTSELLQAIRNRDVEEYARVKNVMQGLEKECRRVQQLDEDIEQLRRILPKLTDELKRSYNDPCWDSRAQKTSNAWDWARAKLWIEEYIRKEDAPSLAIRARQIEDEINGATAKVAALYAWSFCFSRLKENHRRHMQAWQQSMRRLGKGTGKHAPRRRREARQHLNECREAVPAWVMPLHRVWDTVNPAPGMFDFVIVDEASQCGVEALPLFYLGKKILIVGDDKQISPDAVGLDRNAVQRLMDQFLDDFEFKDSFDVESSLFDHGKLRYGDSRVTLREHFRSMPEIIRFSNDLCYSATPLVPLRQYGPERLTPLEHIFVRSGHREGSNNRVVNRPEADTIVEKIVELCANERYSEKTIGVVALQGNAQASLIEGQLLERLGAEEMERRRLVCGNPYSFQGDERDIMFLSMVAAPNERIGPLTKSADERRFNVAASRARDQMFLFHSVTQDDLSSADLRRNLLEFFEHTTPQKIAGMERDELERRADQDNRAIIEPPAPFDSWFEVDVALELVRKGFDIKPQYEVAGKRIDLVIEGGQARLAVECDGDAWHGIAQYQADMQRQRQMERCGWEFFRVRGSAFYANKEETLERLWPMLEERGIFPTASEGDKNTAINGDENKEKTETQTKTSQSRPQGRASVDGLGGSDNLSNRRPEEVTAAEIQEAICRALSKCPNQSCKIDSMTKLVLQDLRVLTRGKPRAEFEKRVKRCLVTLEKRGLIERYATAKNKRVRILASQDNAPTLFR